MSTSEPVVGIPYLKTVPGILKIIEAIFSVAGFVAMLFNYATNDGNVFLTITLTGFIVTMTFLLVYVMELVTIITAPWDYIERFFTVTWVFVCGMVSLDLFYVEHAYYVIPAVIGMLTSGVYAVDAVHKICTLCGWI